MTKLTFNEAAGQMEADSADGESVEAVFVVPPCMADGDALTPLQFTTDSGTFFFFGRYVAAKDSAEFVVAGPSSGYFYKLSLADGNSPYGWKVKKHGVTRGSSVGFFGRILAFLIHFVLYLAGMSQSADYLRDIAQADAFDNEEVVSLPMAMMRLSHRVAVMDSKIKCIGPWAFYGPSLPEAFCRCHLKIVVSQKFSARHSQTSKFRPAESTAPIMTSALSGVRGPPPPASTPGSSEMSPTSGSAPNVDQITSQASHSNDEIGGIKVTAEVTGGNQQAFTADQEEASSVDMQASGDVNSKSANLA